MLEGFAVTAPFLLVLLVVLLTRFIGCSSFSSSGEEVSNTPTPDMASTTTTVTGAPNPSALGDAVTFSVAVNVVGGVPPSAGLVDLREGATLLATSPLDSAGHASVSQPFSTAGTHSIHATYSGVAAAILPSVSVDWPQVVNPGTPPPPPPPPSPIAFRQSAEKNENLNNNSVSTVAFGVNLLAGDLIAVWIFWHAPAAQTISTVTDTAGNTYQRAIGPTAGVGTLVGFQQDVWYAKNVSAGANVKVTATFSGTFSGEKSIVAFEYTGLDKAAPLDKTSVATGSGANAAVGPVMTTAPGVVFAAAKFKTSGMPGSGFTQRSVLKGNVAEEKLTPGPVSVRPTFTNVAQDWIAQMVAFK
jgi:Bacterial Ig-like domain (group 3)